jgi:excisionase family DNA binding protein
MSVENDPKSGESEPMAMDDVALTGRLMTLQEVSAFLGIPAATLYAWRTNGQGPRGVRVGRHVRYQAADVRAWLESRFAKEQRQP